MRSGCAHRSRGADRRMKDGTTHLAYKPEHAVDLDTGAVVAAEVHAADEGDTTTITGTLDAARRNLTSVGAPPSSDDPPGAAQSCTRAHLARAYRSSASAWERGTSVRSSSQLLPWLARERDKNGPAELAV